MSDGRDHARHLDEVFKPGAALEGRYRIERLLGEGGMGRVYLGRDESIPGEPEQVVFKVILPKRNLRADLHRLMSEAASLRKITHAAVVPYREYLPPTDDRPFAVLVMKFIEGETLEQVVEDHRKGLNVRDVRRLAVRLIDALHAAHEQGVVHRDVSPDNIVVPNGDVSKSVVIDFGIAYVRGDDDQPFVGKPDYASPEHFPARYFPGDDGGDAAPRTLEAASDFYSLALVLYYAAVGRHLEMLAEDLPDGVTDEELVAAAAQARREVPDLKGVPPSLRSKLEAMLAPSLEDRRRNVPRLRGWFEPPKGRDRIGGPREPDGPDGPKGIGGIDDGGPGPGDPVMRYLALGAAVIVVAAVASFGILGGSSDRNPRDVLVERGSEATRLARPFWNDDVCALAWPRGDGVEVVARRGLPTDRIRPYLPDGASGEIARIETPQCPALAFAEAFQGALAQGPDLDLDVARRSGADIELTGTLAPWSGWYGLFLVLPDGRLADLWSDTGEGASGSRTFAVAWRWPDAPETLLLIAVASTTRPDAFDLGPAMGGNPFPVSRARIADDGWLLDAIEPLAVRDGWAGGRAGGRRPPGGPPQGPPGGGGDRPGAPPPPPRRAP
ncbi:MAG: serine/threonine-protein kinase, partial [Shimia sp.]